MKKLDKIILALFFVLMFLASILIICVIVGWIELNTVNTFANMAISNQAVGIPIAVPRKAQRLTSEDGKPIISTREPDSYS